MRLSFFLSCVCAAAAAAFSGCGGAGGGGAATAGAATCDPSRLDTCERAIVAAQAADKDSRDLCAAYAAARASRDEADPWAKLWKQMVAPKPATVAVVLEGAAKTEPIRRGLARVALLLDTVLGPKRPSDRDGYRVVELSELPAPRTMKADELLLALGAGAGADHLIHVRPGGVTEMFPRDPLGPFVAGLPAILNADDEIADDVAIAIATRQALDHAAELRFVDAAGAADRLGAALAKRDPLAEPAIRGRYAHQLLSGAGIVLEPEPPAAELPPAPAYGAPRPADSVYGDYLRVRTAQDSRAEWTVRRGKIQGGIAADRRRAFDALYAAPGDCAAAAEVPPMSGARDLPFAARVAGALAADEAPTAGALPLAEWLPRYEAMVDAVDRTRTMWAYAPSVLYQRGEVAGLSPTGSAVYRRVTELGKKHLAAIEELEKTFPARYRALSHLPLVYSPGVLGDDKLRDVVVRLTQVTVQDKLARATDAPAVFEGVLAGVFAGMSYPPAIQAAHYLALQGAFTAKLRGDLTKRTGWEVAGLYAADAVFRIVTDQAKDLGFSSTQIARALADKSIPHPSLAALATSLARYAVLGQSAQLDPEQAKDRAPPERRAAREALKEAIRGLGDDKEASEGLLEDMTELGDGLIAAVSAELGSRKGGPEKCAKDEGPSPAVRRSLAKLGDVRRRVLLQPKIKQGDGTWIRRVRLLATVLSDALDVLARTKKPSPFTVSGADAERWIAGGLRDWDEPGAAESVTAAYLVVRDVYAAKSADDFVKASGPRLRRALTGALGLFRAGSPLLEALASMPLGTEAGRSQDASALLLSYAKGFYERKQDDQGDLLLICTLSIAALSHAPPPREAIELAAKHRSRVEWALQFLTQVANGKSGTPPDPSAFEAGMRKTTDDACAVASVDEVVRVMGAVRQFASGKRAEARAALDQVLERAESKGLPVPKMTYRYEEKTRTKVFALSLDVSYGGGLLESSNSLQIGLGIKSPGEPGGAMTATLAPPKQTTEEAARYYVHVAALASAYHFLEGDTGHAGAAAARAVSALVGGVRLGPRAVVVARPVDWAADSRALLAIDAQLAAESGDAFLAGDLWTVLRGSLPPDATDATVREILDKLPLGLAAVKDLGPLVDRARRSLAIVAHALPCTGAKVELGGFEEVPCETYPLAISLRVADTLNKLPRLARAAPPGSRCDDARAIDKFLGALDKKTYDPDAFTRALERMRASDRTYDAAILLTRLRNDAHCSPAIVTAARALGRAPGSGSGLRSDLLSVAVNCSTQAIDAAVLEDLAALDDETRRLADPTRNFRLVLFVTDLSLRAKRPDVLAKIAGQPEFVDRWLKVNPTAATAALVVDHAAALLDGKPVGVERTRAAYTQLCELFPPGDRGELCAQLKTMRGAGKDAPRVAREALEKLVVGTAAKP